MQRPSIPEELKREVLMEAGHRCAIPTCQSVPVELAHIIPWSKVMKHSFSNLIALCPTCHTRFDKGDIDIKSMRLYKQNLSLLSGRYGELERRILRAFSNNLNAKEFTLPGGFDIMLMNLLDDGLIIDTGKNSGIILSGIPSAKIYAITDKGRDFINNWINAEEIE